MELLAETLAASFVAHNMLPNVPQTLEGARMLHQGNLAVFPDVQTRTDDLFAEGDMVVEGWQECTITIRQVQGHRQP